MQVYTPLILIAGTVYLYMYYSYVCSRIYLCVVDVCNLQEASILFVPKTKTLNIHAKGSYADADSIGCVQCH